MRARRRAFSARVPAQLRLDCDCGHAACRYGQRALVNENVGSLVNTLSLHQHADLRLEAFARLLSEEWDVSIFIDFLSATGLCMQVRRRAACCDACRALHACAR